MQINLASQRGDAPMTLSRLGDVLTINDEAFDFSGIPDGATLPREAVACPSLLSGVERIAGEIVLTLFLAIGPNAPEASRFPVPIIDPPDGAVALPDFGAAPE